MYINWTLEAHTAELIIAVQVILVNCIILYISDALTFLLRLETLLVRLHELVCSDQIKVNSHFSSN